MKVRILTEGYDYEIGEIVEAKRERDLTDDEFEKASGVPSLWKGDEIFIKMKKPDCIGAEYVYMYDWEIEVVEE